MSSSEVLGHQISTVQTVIDDFLRDFNDKCDTFKNYCDLYLEQSVNIADITRYLSEATADAEQAFAEHSFGMNLEQLQRYGTLQATLDHLIFELFNTEIKRNHLIICESIKNGDYFIVNLTFNAIKSSIYMLYSKQKIKTDQEQQLNQMEKEQEALQALIKVLKAIEGVIKIDRSEPFDYQKIQKALEIYSTFFKTAQPTEAKLACDQRVFNLFAEHVDFLHSIGFAGDPARASAHFAVCCKTLQALAMGQHQAMQLAAWRDLLL